MPLPMPPNVGQPIAGPQGGAVNVQQPPSGLAMFLGTFMQSLQDRQAQEREQARAEMQQIQNLMSLGLSDQIDWKKAGSVAKKAGLDKFLDFSKPATPQAQTTSPEQEARQGLPPGGPGGPPQAGTPSQQGGPQGLMGHLGQIGKGVGKAFGLDFSGVDPNSPGVMMLQQMAPLLAKQGEMERSKLEADTAMAKHQKALMEGDPKAQQRQAAIEAAKNPVIAMSLAQGKTFEQAQQDFYETPQIKIMRDELKLRQEQMNFDQRMQADAQAAKMQETYPLAPYSLLSEIASARSLGMNDYAMSLRSLLDSTPSKWLLETANEQVRTQAMIEHNRAMETAALRQYNLEVMKAANEVTGGLVKQWADLAGNKELDSEQREKAFEGLADALTRYGAIQVPMPDGTSVQLGPEVVVDRIKHWYQWGPLPGEYGRPALGLKQAPKASEQAPSSQGTLDKMTEWLKNNLSDEEKKALQTFGRPFGISPMPPSGNSINFVMPTNTPGASRTY